jgi:hypothetical protein
LGGGVRSAEFLATDVLYIAYENARFPVLVQIALVFISLHQAAHCHAKANASQRFT